MENLGTTRNDYEKAREAAKKFYYSIGSVVCPVVQGVVTFNNMGFHHLVHKGKRPRSKQDQMRRFRLLKYAADILANPNSSCTEEGKKADNVIPGATFWNVSGRAEGKLVTVVVRQVGIGKTHFFSIYDQKIARKPCDSLECLPPA